MESPPIPAAVTPARNALVRPLPSSGFRGWIGPLLVTVLAGVLRFVDLGRPHAIIFDETYYVKDALALLRFGYEQQAVDGADELILAAGRRLGPARHLHGRGVLRRASPRWASG